MIINLEKAIEKTTVNTISLRKELSTFMEDTDLTKTKVAKLLGLPSYRHVTNILEGKDEITWKCAIAIANLIGISELQLLHSVYKEIKEEDGVNIDNIKYDSSVQRMEKQKAVPPRGDGTAFAITVQASGGTRSPTRFLPTQPRCPSPFRRFRAPHHPDRRQCRR